MTLVGTDRGIRHWVVNFTPMAARDPVDLLLERWADCVQHSIRKELGFPSQNVLHVVSRFGGRAPKSNTRYEDVLPADVERVEAAICRMPTAFREVIEQRYLHGGPDLARAKRLHMSTAWFRSVLTASKAWLSGYLEGHREAG